MTEVSHSYLIFIINCTIVYPLWLGTVLISVHVLSSWLSLPSVIRVWFLHGVGIFKLVLGNLGTQHYLRLREWFNWYGTMTMTKPVRSIHYFHSLYVHANGFTESVNGSFLIPTILMLSALCVQPATSSLIYPLNLSHYSFYPRLYTGEFDGLLVVLQLH